MRMRKRRVIKRIPANAILILATWLVLAPWSSAHAAGVATVSNLSGVLSAKLVDGSIRVLSVKSDIMPGDVLTTEKDSYARIKFSDGGEVTLRPNSQLKIDDYNYDEQKPEKDNFLFSLVKGGLRTVTGLIGKRGNRDAYRLNTANATIGIRGTSFGVLFCNNDCGNIKTASGKTPENGIHIDVAEGAVEVKNTAGAVILKAGEFGYTPSSNIPPQPVQKEEAVKVSTASDTNTDDSKGGSTVGKGSDDKECTINGSN